MVTTFSVEFTDEAADDLGEITKTVAQRILDKIRWLSSNTRSKTILNDDREVPLNREPAPALLLLHPD